MSENELKALIEQLQQENKQLKEKIDKQYNAIVEKDNMLSNRYGVIEHKQQQLDLYKSVVDEVRKLIEDMIYIGYQDDMRIYFSTGVDSEFGIRAKVLLEILDKAKESE